jgi:hypothetical protein
MTTTSTATSDINESLVQLVYTKFCGHYSPKNWVCNYPLYEALSDEDRQFWQQLVQGTRVGFRKDIRDAQKISATSSEY